MNQWRTHVSELHQAELSQLTDAVVGRAGLEEELHEADLLAAEHGAHSDLQERSGEQTHTGHTVSPTGNRSQPRLKPQGKDPV